MSNKLITQMNFNELRTEVQTLSDTLAVFKRKYEDAIYNLDSDNFGKSFMLEQKNMKTQIKVTAEGLKSTVSKTDLEQTLEKYSTIEQTAEKIATTVTAEYVDSLIGDTYVTNAVLSSQIRQTADEIYLEVSEEYETKGDARDNYDALSSHISNVSVKANSISTRVTDIEDFKTSTFTQTAYGFTLDGEKTTFTGVIYLTNNAGEKRFSIFHDESQGYEQVRMNRCTGTMIPLVLGDTDGKVYVGQNVAGSEVATRNWVLANAGSGGTATAVFG